MSLSCRFKQNQPPIVWEGVRQLTSADLGRDTTKPISSAFDGALKVYKIDGSGENDLMQFMTNVKPQFDKLISENVTRTGRKIQLILRTELSKSTKGEETELFLRSPMVPVYGNNLPQADLLTVVDKMVNTVYIHRIGK